MGRFSSDRISSFVDANKSLEPHRTYNWELYIHGISGVPENDLQLSVESGGNPNVSFEEITLGYGNDEIHIPGKAKVEPISFTFRDFIEPGTAKLLWKWYTIYYDAASGGMGRVSDYKKTADLFRYAPWGELKGGWKLHGIWIQSANFGSLDFNTSDIIKVECNFRFDRAIEN